MPESRIERPFQHFTDEPVTGALQPATGVPGQTGGLGRASEDGATESSPPIPARQAAPSSATRDGAVPKRPRSQRRAAAAKPPTMSEAQLQAAVVDMCKLFGLHCHHQRYSIGSVAGWPDLIVLGRAAIARELKNDTNQPTGAQDQWGLWLVRAGIPWDIWRPADLHSGRIQRELEALR